MHTERFTDWNEERSQEDVVEMVEPVLLALPYLA
jgi:hypothetical protein